MVGRCVLKGCSRDKDLISPKDGEAAVAGAGVDSGLADDGFENGDGFDGSGGEGVADGEFLFCF